MSTQTTLVISRKRQLTGCLSEITLMMDGKPLTVLSNGEQTTLNVPAGEHTFGIKQLRRICLPAKITVEDNKTYQLEYGFFESVFPCNTNLIVPGFLIVKYFVKEFSAWQPALVPVSQFMVALLPCLALFWLVDIAVRFRQFGLKGFGNSLLGSIQLDNHVLFTNRKPTLSLMSTVGLSVGLAALFLSLLILFMYGEYWRLKTIGLSSSQMQYVFNYMFGRLLPVHSF